MSLGLVIDERFKAHDTGAGHPECPARLDHAQAEIERGRDAAKFCRPPLRAASIDDIERIHTLEYVRRAQTACSEGAPFLDTPDVALSAASFDTALLAAGAGPTLADAMMAGDFKRGFALVRPPGHHAERSAAMGFCLFNNVAILARYLQQTHGMEKIAIVDWDVHHGNGTQHSFESDPSVLYVSLHQYPYYPGTGAYSETGTGAGRGATLNCPMPAGATNTAYERAFAEQVLPALELFAADCLIISAGFDAHQDDPLADVRLTTPAYRWMTERLVECAEHHGGGRVISMLEGGYHLDRLAECVAEHLEALRDKAR